MADISIIHNGSTDYNVKDTASRAALVEVENKGAKNDFDLENKIDSAVSYHANTTLSHGVLSVSATGNWARTAVPYLFKKGTSTFSCTVSNYTKAGGTIVIRFAENADSTNPLCDGVTITGNGNVSIDIAVNSDTNGYIIYYIDATSTSYANSADFSNNMICTKAEWDISNAFVSYGKTNPELTLLEQQDRDGLATAIDKGAKNVADMSKTSFTTNEKDGVTVTLSGDTITSTGTSGTSVNQFHRILYNGDDLLIPPGTWIAALIGTGTDAFRIEVMATGYADLVKGTYGSPVEFTVPDNATTSYLRITQKPSTNCAGTFKLIITTKAQWDISQTYEPYARSNPALTAEMDYVANAGVKNLLNFDAWKDVGVTRCTKTISGNSITITSTGADSFTWFIAESTTAQYPVAARIPVEAGKTYRLSWTANNNNKLNHAIYGNGTAGRPDNVVYRGEGSGYLDYTAASDVTFITFRLGLYDSGKTTTFSNVMIRPAAITDISYQPYARTNPVLTAEMDYVVNTGVKNYCPKETETSTGSGFTADVEVNIPAGTYILSFTGTLAYTASFNLYRALPHSGNSLASINLLATTGAQSVEFTITEAAKYIAIYHNGNGNSLTNIMLRPAEITDATFQPFARTNRELTVLTDEDRAALVEMVDGGAKNLLKNELGSGTKSGLAYTTGTDGSIVITAGTATRGNADFVIPFTPKESGQYVLQGCPSGGSGATYKGQITLYPSMTNVVEVFDDTSVTATLTGGTQYAYRFRVYNGKAIGDVTIYPMVCSEAAWKISHAYKPYSPSWQEIYLSRGVQIQSGDLDDYKSMGRYYIAQASHAAAITHSPTTTAGYTLTVEQGYQAPDGTIQTATVLDTDNSLIVYRRLYRQRSSVWGWSSWYKFEGVAMN